jgi:hypothetical protein
MDICPCNISYLPYNLDYILNYTQPIYLEYTGLLALCKVLAEMQPLCVIKWYVLKAESSARRATPKLNQFVLCGCGKVSIKCNFLMPSKMATYRAVEVLTAIWCQHIPSSINMYKSLHGFGAATQQDWVLGQTVALINNVCSWIVVLKGWLATGPPVAQS